MTIKKKIQELHKLYPNLLRAEISYEGSGDSFDDFWDSNFEDGNDSDPTIAETNTDNFISDADELLTYALEHSEADFNNDGSRGEIIIDFVEEEMHIDNNYIVREEQPSGRITFKNEKI